MSVCEFKGVAYAGATPHPMATSPEVCDFKKQLKQLSAHTRKKKKLLLRLSPVEVTLLNAKATKTIARIPASLITWAKHDPKLHCIAIMDTYASPPHCHYIISKQHAETVYRHIMHRLGVQGRMDRAKQLPEDAAAVNDLVVCDSDFPQCFEARLLGVITIREHPGQQVVRDSLAFIKQQLKKGHDRQRQSDATAHGNNVALVLSLEGFRALDILTRAAITSVLASSITYLNMIQDDEEGEILAVVTYDDRLQRQSLQLYQCADGQTMEAIKLLEFASQHTTAKTSGDNPFVCSDDGGSSHAMQLLDKLRITPRLLARSVPRDCLAPVKGLESGQFGKYYLATFSSADDDDIGMCGRQQNAETETEGAESLAVYVIHSDVSECERQQVLSACEILTELEHPNIVSLFGVSVTEEPWLLAFEFAPYGSLSDIIQTCQEKEVRVQPLDRLHLAHQLACALQHLHSRRCVHMDIQAANCLLTYGARLKLSNFFSAHKYDEKEQGYTLRSRTKLALRWLAVETFTLSPRVFTQASDVWGFGVTVWEVLAGQAPYHTMRLSEVHQKVAQGMRPPRPQECSDTLWQLLETTWATDSSIRPSFTTIAQHLQQEMQQYQGQTPQDLGKKVNDQLHAKLQTLSRKATARHRAHSRRASQASRESTLRASGLGGVARANPLFGQRLDAIWELEPSDVEYDDADGSDGEEDEDEDEDDDEATTPIQTNRSPPPRPRNEAPTVAEKSTITVGDLKAQHVILTPKDNQPDVTNPQRQRNKSDRMSLPSRSQSRSNLEINPDMFIPDEYF